MSFLFHSMKAYLLFNEDIFSAQLSSMTLWRSTNIVYHHNLDVELHFVSYATMAAGSCRHILIC
ncbi:unnamed protein product [Musa acuminata subsp. burmannicoides]